MIKFPCRIIPAGGSYSLADLQVNNVCTRLTYDNAEQIADAINSAAALKAENERLRKALKPFAHQAGYYNQYAPDVYIGDCQLIVSDLRNAKLALEPSE